MNYKKVVKWLRRIGLGDSVECGHCVQNLGMICTQQERPTLSLDEAEEYFRYAGLDSLLAPYL